MNSFGKIMNLQNMTQGKNAVDIFCSLIITLILLTVYSAIIWLLWNNVVVRAVSFARPITIVESFGIKLLLDFLF